MTVFNDYARYYDLLYRDKDYEAESAFVSSLIRTHNVGARRVLELGCGTGRHAEILARQGYTVHGVDRSEGMLVDAEQRRRALPADLRSQLSFSSGNACEVRLGKQFDVVVSLFHVMSYMTETADLERAFATARAHLGPGGVFLFDCWYGPAVLTEHPEVRVKRLADESMEITRIAEPCLYPNDNCVAVNYDVLVTNRQTGNMTRFHECHRMRYLFLPEVHDLFLRNGMHPIFSNEWLTGKEPGTASWSVVFGGLVPDS